MKNWKQRVIVGFCAILGIAFAFFACDDGNNETHIHDYAATWSKDATQHWRECSCGDKTDIAAHTAGDWIIDQAATVTIAGSRHKECTVCGYVIETETIPVTHTHDWGNWIITTFPTETANGIETRTCTVDETHIDTRTITLATFQTYFYGTWARDDPNQDPWGFTPLTASSIEVYSNNISLITIEILEWSETNNEDNDTKGEFPYGFTLSGKTTYHSTPSLIGTSLTSLIFINATKNKLFFKSTPQAAGFPLIKQEGN